MTKKNAINHVVNILRDYDMLDRDAKIVADKVVRSVTRDLNGGVRLGTDQEIAKLLRARANAERSWPHPSPKDIELANKLEIAASLISGDWPGIALDGILREIERRLDLPVIDNADMRERKALKICQEALRGLLGESE